MFSAAGNEADESKDETQTVKLVDCKTKTREPAEFSDNSLGTRHYVEYILSYDPLLI